VLVFCLVYLTRLSFTPPHLPTVEVEHDGLVNKLHALPQPSAASYHFTSIPPWGGRVVSDIRVEGVGSACYSPEQSPAGGDTCTYCILH